VKLPKPDATDFEEICAALFREEWSARDCQIVGRSGQGQRGVDILATVAGEEWGVQCKCYHATRFTIATVLNDVAKADAAKHAIARLLFATTAPRDFETTVRVRALSKQRESSGQFSVAVLFWEDIEVLLTKHVRVASRFFPAHPQSALSQISDGVNELRSLQSNTRLTTDTLRETVHAAIRELLPTQVVARPAVGPQSDSTTEALTERSGDAIRQSTLLDVVRDEIVALRTVVARRRLLEMGPPEQLATEFLRFRWHSNLAAIELFENNFVEAERGYEIAYRLRPNDTKAIGGRIRSLLLSGKRDEARERCATALEAHRTHEGLWSLRIAIDQLDEQRLRDLNPPPNISSSFEVRYALGGAADSRGDYALACKYFSESRCDGTLTLEVRRALLTTCISWIMAIGAGVDPSVLTREQRDFLDLALTPRDETLQALSNIEAKPIAMELANNAFVALKLLGDGVIADRFAGQFGNRFPDAPALLAAELEDCVASGGWSLARKKYLDRLPTMPAICRLVVAEVAAHEGDTDWFDACERLPTVGGLDETGTALFAMLAIVARWKDGDREVVIRDMQSLTARQPNLATAAAALSQMLNSTGRREDARLALEQARSSVNSATTVRSRLALADAFFDIGDYAAARDLFHSLVATPQNDRATRRWLACLIRTGNLTMANATLGELPAADRSSPAILQLEIELAIATSDLPLLVDLLQRQLYNRPNDATTMLYYASTLLALDRMEELTRLLDSDPPLTACTPRQAFEFAKLQIQAASAPLGLKRLYLLWRNHPADVDVAQYYLSQRITCNAICPAFGSSSEDFAVRVEYQEISSWVAVDSLSNKEGVPWPESTPGGGAFANELRRATIGEFVQRPGLFPQRLRVLEKIPLEQFVVDKARDLVAKGASAHPILQVINVGSGKIGDFVRDLTAQARQTKNALRFAFQRYSRSGLLPPLPIMSLAEAIGKDEYDVLRDWPIRETPLFVAYGSAEAQAQGLKRMAESFGLVIDLLTLFELHRLRRLDALVARDRQLLVPFHALSRLRAIKAHKSIFQKDSESLSAIASVLSFVTSQCTAVPVLGVSDETQGNLQLRNALDTVSMAALDLARERGLPLLTIDLHLAWVVRQTCATMTVDIQSALRDALRRGALPHRDYAACIANLASNNRRFVSFNANDLLVLATDEPQAASEEVLNLLLSTADPSIETAGALNIGCEFLTLAASAGVAARVVGHYAFTLRGALVATKRLISHRSIELSIIERLEAVYGAGGILLSPPDRVALSPLLVRKVGRRFLRSSIPRK